LSITGSIVIFVILWWIVFFSLLPIDVNRKRQDIIKGTDPGAPENPKMLKKIILSTLITSLIFIILYLLVKYDYFNLRNLIS
tara:strand:+ start:4744 stop:4989 length:246 start_codon:yes stop_codon:yes gene_type:complete